MDRSIFFIIIILCAVSNFAQTNPVIYEKMLDSMVTISPVIDSIETNIDTLKADDVVFTGNIDVDGLTTLDSVTTSLGVSITGNLNADSLISDGGGTFADDVIVTGRVRQSEIWHVFGGFQDSSATVAVSADTWTTFTNASNNLWTGTEIDGFTLSGDTMTVTNTGDYVGSITLTVAALNGKDYHLRLYNATQTRQEGYLTGLATTGATNYLNVTLTLFIQATAGDELVLQIYGVTDGTDITAEHGVFYITYLHD